MVDPCLTAAHDPVLGTLNATTAANVQQSVAAPMGLVHLAVIGAQAYGLFDDHTVRPLGVFPNLVAGAPITDVRTPADRTAVVYLSNYLAKSGTQLLAGYTKLGMTIPGSVALIETTDAGVRYFDAPGNYSAAGISDGFAVNGTGLDGRAGTNVWMLNTTDGGTHPLAVFDSSWMAASGFTAATTSSVLLLGYFHGGTFANVIRAAPPLQYTPAVQSAMPFQLALSVQVSSSGDLVDYGAFGPDALAIRGGFRATYFTSYTNLVERIPLSLAGSTVTVGTPVTLLSSMNECTHVAFNAVSGSDVLLGIKDKNGLRVVRLAP